MNDWEIETTRLRAQIANVQACMDVAAPNKQQALLIDLFHYNDELQKAHAKLAADSKLTPSPTIVPADVTETETVRCIFAARTRLRS